MPPPRARREAVPNALWISLDDGTRIQDPISKPLDLGSQRRSRTDAGWVTERELKQDDGLD
jgi:hypothetical protein